MKHEPIDNLFRTRLEQHETRPSSEGWDKLEGMLEASDSGDGRKKRRGIIWWSGAAVAAAVILLAIYTGADFGPEEIQNGTIADNTTVIDSETPAETDENTPLLTPESAVAEVENNEPETPEMPEMKEAPVVVAKNQATQKKPEKMYEPVTNSVTDSPETIVVQAETEEMPNKTIGLPEIENENTGPALAENTEGKIELPDVPDIEIETLVASAEEKQKSPVTISYVDAPDESSEKKKFSVKKIIGLAKDIKEGEVGIGDLRQAKDNILAAQFSRTSD